MIDVIGQEELLFSEHHACPHCGFSIGELEPRMFSFNSPFGACPSCDGLGSKLEVDPELVIPNKDLSLRQHAIAPWEPQSSQYYPQLLEAVCTHYGIDMDIPVKDIPSHLFDKILYGSGSERIYFKYENDFGQVRENEIEFEGVLRNIERRYKETSSDYIREQMEKYMANQPCPTCKGYRLKKKRWRFSSMASISEKSPICLSLMPLISMKKLSCLRKICRLPSSFYVKSKSVCPS